MIGRRIWESGRSYYCVTKVWEGKTVSAIMSSILLGFLPFTLKLVKKVTE